jgi:predicted enzyme related to lactoylglutathione lyase
VKDVDQIASRAQTLGGTVIYGPTDVPGGPRIAMFTDPQGAMLAVYA